MIIGLWQSGVCNYEEKCVMAQNSYYSSLLKLFASLFLLCLPDISFLIFCYFCVLDLLKLIDTCFLLKINFNMAKKIVICY